MKNKYLASLGVAAAFTLAAIGVCSGQTASFSYNDGNGTPNAGTYAPGSSFTFSISLAFTAGGTIANLEGLSYWLEQQNLAAPFNFAITARDVTGSQFTDLQTPILSLPETMTPQNASDLGGLRASLTGAGNGNYFVANITFSIDPSTAPGTYMIRNSTTAGNASVIADDVGHTFAIPQSSYAVTVVPEPATYSLLILAGLGVGGLRLFRHRQSGRL